VCHGWQAEAVEVQLRRKQLARWYPFRPPTCPGFSEPKRATGIGKKLKALKK